MEHTLIYLPKEQWEGTAVPIAYTTEEYYDIAVEREEDGFAMKMKKRRFAQPVTHTPEEYDFPDRLYEKYWEKAG